MANHMKAGPSPPGRKLCRSGLVVTAALLFLFAGMWLYVFSTGLVPGLYLGLGCVLSCLLCAGVFSSHGTFPIESGAWQGTSWRPF